MSKSINNHLKLHQLSLVFTQLERFRLNKLFTDVTIIDGNGATHLAHKNILAASSNYFKKKLYVDPYISEISFANTSTRIVEAMLNFIYTGTLDIAKTDIECIEELSDASRDFQLPLLDAYCSQIILSSLPVEEFLSRWQYAERSNKEEIKKKVAAMMAKDFMVVESSSNFSQISIECLQMVLARQEIMIHNYNLVFQAILKWVNHDIEGRAIHIKTLAKDIDWQAVSTELLNKLVANEDDKLMDECPFLMRRIFNELQQRLKNSKQQQNAPPLDLTQNSPESTPAASSSSKNNNLQTNVPPDIDQYKDSNIQTSSDSVFCKIVPHSEIILADNDFVKDLTEKLVMVKVYEDKSLIEVRKLNENKIKKTIEVNDVVLPFSAAVCHDEEKIYIIGGRNFCQEILSTFYSFNVKTEKWEILTHLNLERWGAGATVVNGYVCAVGGVTVEYEILNKVECYSPISRKWMKIKDMKSSRVGPAVCGHNNCIFVVGGFTVLTENWVNNRLPETTASCEIYNLKTNQWTLAETIMPIGRNINETTFVIGVMLGNVFAIRSYCDGKFVMFIYNPDSCKWVGLPVSYVKAPIWLNVGVLKNRVLCFVDDAGDIFINKCNNLKKIQVPVESRPYACYSAVFD